MQDLFFIFFSFLSIINIIIKGSDNFFDDYMELDNTNCIKGIFVWQILFCHKRSYGNNKYYIYLIIIGKLGQKVVSMFFFIQVLEYVNQIKKKELYMFKL